MSVILSCGRILARSECLALRNFVPQPSRAGYCCRRKESAAGTHRGSPCSICFARVTKQRACSNTVLLVHAVCAAKQRLAGAARVSAVYSSSLANPPQPTIPLVTEVQTAPWVPAIDLIVG